MQAEVKIEKAREGYVAFILDVSFVTFKNNVNLSWDCRTDAKGFEWMIFWRRWASLFADLVTWATQTDIDFW